MVNINDPHAIIVHCDGAMSLKPKQIGGGGFVVEFPDDYNIQPVESYFRMDNQGINRIEMASILEAIIKLQQLFKQYNLKNINRILIYTDRFNATDEEDLNPYKIAEYRKNKWKNFEGKDIKNKDILDKIDKERKKLYIIARSSVEIKYKKEKSNKKADKLSRLGRDSQIRGSKILDVKKLNVTRRKFNGEEIDYTLLNADYNLSVRIYGHQIVDRQYEILAEIIDGKHLGCKVKIYVSSEQKQNLHRTYNYQVKIYKVFRYHITINSIFDLKQPE